MSLSKNQSLSLARDGEITCRNFSQRGYERLARGVYGKPPPETDPDQYRARRQAFLRQVQALMAPYADEPVALFGPTAMQVLGVALPDHLEDWHQCHIIVPYGAYRPERRDVVTHVGQVKVWRQVYGLPVLHPVDHWLQLRGASIQDLIEVGDGLVRRRRPLLRWPDVTGRLDELTGAAGVKAVRRAVRWVVPGTDSLYESRTRVTMVRNGLPVPRVNFPVYVPSSDRLYHLDMAYQAERVGVEFDGVDHVGDVRQMNIDAARHRDLQDEGWIVFRVTASQLDHPEQFVRPIERALALRSTALSIP